LQSAKTAEHKPLMNNQDGSSSNKQCAARIGRQKASRCNKQATSGMYCTKHWASSRSARTLRDQMSKWHRLIDVATSQFEKDVDEAIVRSLKDSKDYQRKLRLSFALLAPRLRNKGLQRVEIAGDGNCQFEALVQSGSLPVNHAELRSQVCHYIATLPEVFGDYWDGWDNFEDYLEHMQEDGSWGDHLTLMAAAHILLRPIHVITDSTHESHATMVVEPPEMISQDVWGEPITLIHYGENHYEATRVQSAVKSEW
jgi:hypothetical protein